MRERKKLLLIVFLALTLRLFGNGWGFVEASALRGIGYPMPSDIGANRIISLYVFDEDSFAAALHIPVSLKNVIGSLKNGTLGLGKALSSIFLSFYAAGNMTAVPVAPFLYSLWGTVIAVIGAKLGLNTLEWYSVVNVFYRSSRCLTAVVSSLGIIPFFYLLKNQFKIFHNHSNVPAYVGSFLLSVSPAHVVNSHWVSYNPLMVTFELFGLWLVLCLCQRISSSDAKSIVIRSLLTGLWLGIAIGTKYTALALLPLLGLGLLIGFRNQYRHKSRLREFYKSWYFRTMVIVMGMSILTYLLLISPALFSKGFGNVWGLQGHIALGTGDLSKGGRWGQLIFPYLTLILPTGIGWWVYLCGWLGLIVLLKSMRKLSISHKLLLLWVFILFIAFTSNPLGLNPERSLTLFALWIILAVIGLEFLYYRVFSKQRSFVLVLGVWLTFSGTVSAIVVDNYLVSDTNGYRTQASKYFLDHIPVGSTIAMKSVKRSDQIDITAAELRLLEENQRLYRYSIGEPTEVLAQIESGYALFPNSIMISGQLSKNTCVSPETTFDPSIARELPFQRFLRLLIGQPSWQRLLPAPSINLYRVHKCVQ